MSSRLGRNREALRYAIEDRKPLRDALRGILSAERGEEPSDATLDRVINEVIDFMRYGDTDGNYFN
jgi:hypothetical protein